MICALGKVLDLGGLDLGDNANSLVHVVRNVGVVRAGMPTTGERGIGG